MAGSISKDGTAVFASLKRLPNPLALPKAFQTNALRLFGFFAPRLFTKASFRHILETKKPLICMRGFVAGTGIEPVFAP